MAIDEITAIEVRKAIEECDSVGQEAFLDRYRFGEARTYKLIYEGRDYASKAVLGAAHQYVPGESAALTSKDFSGGKADAAKRLRALGFDVTGPGRNAAWNRDELILALDLYVTNPASPPGKESAAVAELSALLNKMLRLKGEGAGVTYRNANGVYLKMMNLRALDPSFTSQGKVGMKAGGALEKVIWDEYAGRHVALVNDAKAIRDAVNNADETAMAGLPSGEPYEGEEGGVIMRLHKRYERDPRIIAEKRKAAKAAGTLACEVCGFDFEATYGQLGAEYIEVHHLKPVHAMRRGAKTKLADLALLCANCHRMAHRKRNPLDLVELKRSIKR